jgi:hypothetical protein
MTPEFQSVAALGIVALTLLAFAVRAWRQRRRPAGCGGGCACPSVKFKRG